ncbi:hypothetical protein PHMEG_00024310 [Phytophthora megakarya]|uniref:Uncharacterized protein n=1 Tax=Phytophthora megakarya TaxID=4795 RepID=A0A225VEZ4_9STRA|nr:hypothetical protein PHMEG_00024310 [Phytophthora megakarya]
MCQTRTFVAFKEPEFEIYVRILDGMKLRRLWNRLLDETLIKDAGMTQSGTDACVYYKITSHGTIINFMGIRIDYRKDGGYTIDSEHTILPLAEKFGLEKANAVRSPIADESTLASEGGDDKLLPNNGPGTPERPTVRLF